MKKNLKSEKANTFHCNMRMHEIDVWNGIIIIKGLRIFKNWNSLGNSCI